MTDGELNVVSYNLLRKGRTRRGGRVAMYVRDILMYVRDILMKKI